MAPSSEAGGAGPLATGQTFAVTGLRPPMVCSATAVPQAACAFHGCGHALDGGRELICRFCRSEHPPEGAGRSLRIKSGQPAFLADLVVSKSLRYDADLHASVGYEMNGDPDEVEVADALRWGIGVNVPARRLFQVQAEVTGRVWSDTSPKQTNTVDFIVGPAIWLRPGWFIRPAWSYAVNYDGRGRDVSFAKRSGKQGAPAGPRPRWGYPLRMGGEGSLRPPTPSASSARRRLGPRP